MLFVNFWDFMTKRLFDIVISLFLGLLLLPLIVLTAVLVFLNFGWPVIFSQTRPGYKGRLFNIYKFRSMTNELDEAGNLSPDHIRLTRFGKLIRATSLDELPEIWNVLIGNMSLVGPRPLLVEYLAKYNAQQSKRHDVRPGITGWAQVNGRNAISWKEKFDLDVWYVENHNLWLDFKILIITIQRVLFRSGIAAEGHVTMTKFDGNIE